MLTCEVKVNRFSLLVQIDKVSDEIDAAVEPVMEELEKELDESTMSSNAVNTKN